MSAPVSPKDAPTVSPTSEDSKKLYDDWQARVFKQPTTQLYSQLISTPELTVGHKMILAQRLYQNIQSAISTMPELAAREMTIANDVTYSKTVQLLTATSLAAPAEDDGEKSPLTSTSCSTTAAQSAAALTLVVQLYRKECDRSGIHENRFPSWQELDSNAKRLWIETAEQQLGMGVS